MKIFRGIFATLICVCSGVYCQWTSITYITEKSIVNTGSTAKLTCKVSYPIDFQGSISWLKVNKTNDENVSSVVLSNGNAVNVQDSRFLLRQDINIIGTRLNSNSYTLMINSVKETDAGWYLCRVSVESNNTLSAEVQLEVATPPIIFANSSVSLTVRQYRPAKLECYASGFPMPNVWWSRLLSHKVIHRGNVLEFASIKKEDGGIYNCIAENDVGQVSQRRIEVLVEYAPVVTAPITRIGQALQNDVEILCKVQAYPPPVIVWLKNGLQLPNNTISHSNAADDTVHSVLSLYNIDCRQYGDYICSASNIYGTAGVTINLHETTELQCPYNDLTLC